MEMERILAEPMFDAPTPHVLITEDCVDGSRKASYWGKDGHLEVQRKIQEEDSADATAAPDSLGFENFREAGLGVS